MKPKISVVIPAYNAERFIRKALDSIAAQIYENYEIIVVNDGSTDNTLENIVEYVVANPEIDIRVVDQENMGVPSSRNVGIQLAKGKYVCFLDADDEYCADSLKYRVECLEHWGLDFIIGHFFKKLDINKTPKKKNTLKTKFPGLILSSHDKFLLCDSIKVREIVALRGFPMHPNTFTFNTEFLKKLGMFDQSLSVNEDTELIYRAMFHVKQFGFVDEELAIYNYYTQYLDYWNNTRIDIEKFYKTERNRFIKLMRLLRNDNADYEIVRGLKRRMCARKYKYKGLCEYRKGKNIKALKYYFKAKAFDANDQEIKSLIKKAYVPSIFKNLGLRVIQFIRSKKYHADKVF